MSNRSPEFPEWKFEDLPFLPFSEIREVLDDLLTAMYRSLTPNIKRYIKWMTLTVR